MMPINIILLTLMIVFFLLGISESILTHRNGSFPAAKLQPGHNNILNSLFKEQDAS
ncbi:17210_t:CDS:1, partial [Racocetra persica]